MGAHTKQILVRRLLAALTPAGTMPITPAQAVTRLVKLGMATGNAQRLMDPDQDVRLSTVEDVAARLVQSIPIERTPAVHIVEVPQDAFETVRCVVVVTEAGVSAACPTKGIDLTDPATP